jgi:5-methylcytosine-specific restriction endonuclease McrA
LKEIALNLELSAFDTQTLKAELRARKKIETAEKIKAERKPKTQRKTEYAKYLRSDKWKEIRQKVFDLDGNRCCLCGSMENLRPHHRKYPKVLGEEPLNDLLTLCNTCHFKFHQQQKKGDGSSKETTKRIKKILSRREKRSQFLEKKAQRLNEEIDGEMRLCMDA